MANLLINNRRDHGESCNRFRAHVPVRLQPHCIRNQACGGRYHGIDGHRTHHGFISFGSCDNRRRAGSYRGQQYHHIGRPPLLGERPASQLPRSTSRLGQFKREAGSRVLCIGNATQLARRPRDLETGVLVLVSLSSMSLHSTSM